jgi:transcriptional regulator with PAS, ATPase and Fis domain
MIQHAWVKEFPGAVTVCNPDGIILAMNDVAMQNFEVDSSEKLIGANLLDCHPKPARLKLERLMEARQRNVYTIEKKGVKKLIYQTPWYEDGQYRGFVELVLEIPFMMTHFVRDPQT